MINNQKPSGKPGAGQMCEEQAYEAGREEECDALPIFGTGSNSPEATQHDRDSIAANPEWSLLTYRKNSEANAAGIFRPDWSTDPACTNMPVGYQCDEFPYFSTEEGHPEPVDLRPIPAGDNASQGGHLTAFYRCPLLRDSAQESADRRFLVVPLPFPLPTLTYCPPRLP